MDKDEDSTSTTTTSATTAIARDEDKNKGSSESYTKYDVIVFCKDRSDWLGYNIGQINDLLTNDMSLFEDLIIDLSI